MDISSILIGISGDVEKERKDEAPSRAVVVVR